MLGGHKMRIDLKVVDTVVNEEEAFAPQGATRLRGYSRVVRSYTFKTFDDEYQGLHYAS